MIQEKGTYTQLDMQRTIEQSRATSEEMRSANEEVMAMNEELQSANEELESSKEELQSLNEELTTSNSNLEAKNTESDLLNADLYNLLRSSETATLMLDAQLKIRRYSPAMTSLMKLIDNDIGRHIDDLVRLVNDPLLIQDCSAVLLHKKVASVDNIRDNNHHWFMRRVLPYKDAHGTIAGVVVNYVDITSLKEAGERIREHTEKLEWKSNLLAKAAPIIARDSDDRIIFWNQGAETLYGWTETEALGKVIYELLKTVSTLSFENIKNELLSKQIWIGELLHFTKNGNKILVESQWTAYHDYTGNLTAIVEVNKDITLHREAQQSLAESEVTLKTMMDWTYNWEYWLAPNGNVIYMTPSVLRITGYTAEEFERNPALCNLIIHEQDTHLWERHVSQYLAHNKNDVFSINLRIHRKNGELRWINHTSHQVFAPNGAYLGLRVSVLDITDKKLAEDQILELANFDPLTHLPNRRLLQDRMNQSLITSERHQQFCGLLMIDLDYFKKINDSEGHDIGDKLLIETARSYVFIGRLWYWLFLSILFKAAALCGVKN